MAFEHSLNISFSPNAEEALKLLSMSFDNTKLPIEYAAHQLLALNADKGCVIIRSGSLGAFVLTKAGGGRWVDAYWNDAARIVDVTGISARDSEARPDRL